MNFNDLNYAASLIFQLSRMPVRLYREGERVAYFAPEGLSADPLLPYLQALLSVEAPIGYYITPRSEYYGVIGHQSYRIILGPTKQIKDDDQAIKSIAFELDVPPEQTETFIAAVKSLSYFPLEMFLHILCALHFMVNGEKSEIQDIAIYQVQQTALTDAIEEEQLQRQDDDTPDYDETREASLSVETERVIMDMISQGDTERLKEWIGKAPTVRGGVLANDQLRQSKNTFIVITALSARAAIRGGMDSADAMILSDSYIQRGELIGSLSDLINLEYHMVLDYAKRVEALRQGKDISKLVLDVKNYIRHHLSESISVQDIAQHLYIGYSYLSYKFKQETGETLTDFILKEKIEEAKRLLRYTDKSMTSIGYYLGFSSQSHFARTFKKYAGTAPKEFREVAQKSNT